MHSHHFGLPFCDVSQGQCSFNVSSVWQPRSHCTKAWQDLHQYFQAGRVTSVAQNFDTDDEVLSLNFSQRMEDEVMDWLWT